MGTNESLIDPFQAWRIDSLKSSFELCPGCDGTGTGGPRLPEAKHLSMLCVTCIGFGRVKRVF